MYRSLLLVVVGLALTAPAYAVGVGVTIGEPTGLTAKSWVDDRDAWVATVAWSLDDVHADRLVMQLDRTRHPGTPDWAREAQRQGRTRWYYGLGGRVWLGPRDHLGVRVPLGLAFRPADFQSLEFTFEVAPVLDLVPSTELDVAGGIAVRAWF